MKSLSLRHIFILSLSILFVVGVVLKTGWVAEDAFITFRTVDNFTQGYGLTWNISERVQAYTHPLWLFLLVLTRFLTGELVSSSIFLSIAITALALWVFAFGIAKDVKKGVLAIVILAFSRSFVDYSTSGMENCLTHLLLILFLWQYLKNDFNPKRFFLLSLITGFGLANRMDTVFLFLPPLIYFFRRIEAGQRRGVFLWGLAGLCPFWLWEGFSLFYYGFPFPNTAYAKLNLDIPRIDLIKQGLYYLVQSTQWDYLTSTVMAGGVLLSFVKKRWNLLATGGGILLYLFYVIWIAGDYMAGRFLSAPFVSSVIIVISSLHFRSRVFYGAAILFVAIVGFRSFYPTFLSGPGYGSGRRACCSQTYLENILDERRNFFRFSSLFSPKESALEWIEEGKQAGIEGDRVIEKSSIGHFGYYAGPKVHIVDNLALADPLLARIPRLHHSIKFERFLNNQPQDKPFDFLVGHYKRVVPQGYLETLESGENKIADRNLAAYYDKLSLVIKGELFDPDRLKEIWNFNIGKYDSLMRVYLESSRMKTVQVSLSESDGKTFDFWEYGLEVDLEREYHANEIELILQSKHDYVVVFSNSDIKNKQFPISNIRARTIQEEGIIEPGVLTPFKVRVPAAARQEGFDKIKVIPRPYEEGEIYRFLRDNYQFGGVKIFE